MIDINPESFVKAAIYLGAACAMGFGAIGSSIGAGCLAREATLGMSRQPKADGKLMRTMLVGQAVSESPGIFSLFIALFLVMGMFKMHVNEVFAMAMLASGIAVGVSSIGSGMGTGLAGGEACKSIARNPDCAGKITLTMLLGQALATSPAVFGFVAALLLILKSSSLVTGSIPAAAALLGAGISMGAGAIGPGLGIGLVGQRACEGVAKNPRMDSSINRTLLLGAAVAESTSIYAFVIFILLYLQA